MPGQATIRLISRDRVRDHGPVTDYSLRVATADDIAVLVRGRVRMFEDMAAHTGTTLDPALAARIAEESASLFVAGWDREHVGWVCEHGFTHLVLHASEQGRPMYERLGFTNSSEWILPLG